MGASQDEAELLLCFLENTDEKEASEPAGFEARVKRRKKSEIIDDDEGWKSLS